MNEIIKVRYDRENPTVSARDLHEGLEIGTKFATWFSRMAEYGFQENVDYKTCYPNLGSENHGGQNMVDYEISVDVAKQICMIQRTDKGRQYRQYFIDLEKAWNTPEQVMARALKIANQTIEKLKLNNQELVDTVHKMDKVIGELKPKADYVDSILKNPSTVLTTQIAQDYGMSAKAFNKKLSEFRIQHKVGGQWILYADYLGKGYVHSKTIDIIRSNGQPDVKMQTEWTPRGRIFLYEELKKHDIYPMIERVE